MKKEVRSFRAVEIRATKGDDGKPKISGYAAVYNSPSDPLPLEDGRKFVEQIAPGAFRSAIDPNGDDVRCLLNHDPNLILGRNKAGTLQLRDDDKGLGFDANPPDTQAGRDAVTSIGRGDIDGCSFGFITLDDEWNEDDDGTITRTVKKVRLLDVGPVVYPAYGATSVDVRSIEAAIATRLPSKETPEQKSEKSPAEKAQEIRDNAQQEIRAILEVDDDTTRCCARWTAFSVRSAFDSLVSLIDEVRTIQPVGQFTDDDREALTDCASAITELAAKCQLALETLKSAGATVQNRDLSTGEELGENGTGETDSNPSAANPEGDPDACDTEIQAMALRMKLCGCASSLSAELRAGHMTHDKSVPTLNGKGEDHGLKLIDKGEIDDGQWEFGADQARSLLGAQGDDWENFAAWHLGIEKNADPKTEKAYKYPYGDGKKVNLRALKAIRSRSSPNGDNAAPAIFEAAGKMLDAANKKLGKSAEQTEDAK